MIESCGFELDDKRLRRAGLDYHEFAALKIHKNFDEFLVQEKPDKLYACSTKGTRKHTEASYKKGDYLIFGPETRGLPAEILDSL